MVNQPNHHSHIKANAPCGRSGSLESCLWVQDCIPGKPGAQAGYWEVCSRATLGEVRKAELGRGRSRAAISGNGDLRQSHRELWSWGGPLESSGIEARWASPFCSDEWLDGLSQARGVALVHTALPMKAILIGSQLQLGSNHLSPEGNLVHL